MDRQHIRALITRFFGNNFSEETFLKFRLWLVHKEDRETKEEVMNELWEKETAKANLLTLHGLEDMNLRIGKERKTTVISMPRRLLRIAAVFLLPVIGATLAYLFMDNTQKLPELTAGIVEHIVPDGEMREIVLPDGSEVWLNAGSLLLYSGDFSGPDRSLFLNGEAVFRVVKDLGRPFIVKTQHMHIEALGTTFNVKSYGDSGSEEVTLEEGLIRVDLNGKVNASELVHPNEQLVYNHRIGKLSRYPVDAELVARWKEGYIVFQDASFEDIIRTVERRFNVVVNYDIRKYGGGSFSIKYTPYENVQQVLTILETLIPELNWSIEDNIVNIK